MSPERNQNPLTLEQIISNAKEIMFRDGNHVPMLIIEGGKSLVAGQIPDLPETHKKRVELMRSLGQAAAKSGRVDQLQQVFMVTEGWMSVAREDGTPEILVVHPIKWTHGQNKLNCVHEGVQYGTDKKEFQC